MSRFIVVAPGSSEAAALATDELARVLGVTTVDALAGTTATDAALRPASALPAVVEAVRAAGDDALISPAREASNRAFDHVAWNLNLAAATRAGVVLAFDAEGASAELLAEEIAAARLRAEAAAASVVAVVLTGGAPTLEADVPVLTLPLGDDAAATLREAPTPTAVTPLAFQADLIERARANRKRIVLPEPDDDRVLQAAAQVLAAGIADITFVGDADYVAKRAGELGLDLSAAQVVSVNDPAYLERYAEEFARLRAKKGVTLEQAREKVTDVSYFGTMMVHMGDADGMVSGAAHTTAHTIVPSFQIIKTAPGVSVVSSIFLMAMKDRVWAFGDCAVNPNPTPEQLADIAVTSARTAAQFGVTPRVAMLSYSNFGSDKEGSPLKVHTAVETLQRECPDLAIDGEMQVNFALNRQLRDEKYPFTRLKGKEVNTLVFPDLSSANSGYKLLQSLSPETEVIGPIQMGLNKPIHFTDFECSVRDIVNITAIAAIDAYVEKLKKNKQH